MNKPHQNQWEAGIVLADTISKAKQLIQSKKPCGLLENNPSR